MRESDYIKTIPRKEELSPGDILRCANGKTYRTILMVEETRVIVEGRSGRVDTIPVSALEEHWLKMVPKAETS